MSTWAVPGYTESLELGSGASGRVVLAVHEDTGIPVAVKYLSESLHTRPGFVNDFRAEARLLGGLDSPYVAGLYEYVESPDGAAIVMELVDGASLRSLLTRQGGPIDPEAALVLLKGSLLGLADAHRIGVVHRDYKPENVLVMPDGASKLVDFGIAVTTGESAGVAGTPSYMAPEQWTGAPASPAGDVYAATATFFECLTGHKPYAGGNLAELALQHVDSPIPSEQVPEAVRSLVLRGLAKSPAERPSHAEAFVAELEAAAVAGYGPDWEERGRARLVALVALLALLLPSARGRAETTTDTARTVLRQAPGRGAGRAHAWRPTLPGVLVAAGAALLAILLAYGLPESADPDAAQAAEALATTSAQPGVASGPTAATSPPATATASESSDSTGSPSPSPSTPEASASDSATVTAPDPTGEDTPSGGTTTTPPPTTESPTTPATPSAPAVKDVTVSGFRQTGPTTGTTTVTVTADGTGPISITVSWYTGDTSGQLGTPDGTPQTFDRSGATQYTLTVDHTFQGTGCYWGVQATTNPASADGGASQQLLTRRCDIR
ncbi:serine/threonine-protein kinase [Streptomyces sp. NPDC087903]|uniref:serine/threonine-protein kinase n=1 Tax=Streptomyces sp. NPDC087903 TaxID=3365819 RepID=UPI0038203E94